MLSCIYSVQPWHTVVESLLIPSIHPSIKVSRFPSVNNRKYSPNKVRKRQQSDMQPCVVSGHNARQTTNHKRQDQNGEAPPACPDTTLNPSIWDMICHRKSSFFPSSAPGVWTPSPSPSSSPSPSPPHARLIRDVMAESTVSYQYLD